MIDVKKLQYHKLSLEKNDHLKKPLYQKVFRMWSQTWEEAYQLYWGSDDIFSDQFTRQSHHIAITYENEIVGSLAYDKKNLFLESTRKDSYFRMWKDEDFKKLIDASEDGSVLVCSWFTLNKSWRKSQRGIDAKKLLLAVAVKEFEMSGESIMCGTMVHTGRLHDICYDHKATIVQKDSVEKGLPVDLIVWKRLDVLKMKYPYYEKTLNQLFNQEVDQQIAA